MLAADEEILWISHRPTITVVEHFLHNLWRLRGFLLVSVIYWCLFAVVLPSYVPITFPQYIRFSMMVGIALSVMYILGYLLFGMGKREKRHTYYAFTNRRILVYQPTTGITSDSLEHVHDVYPANSHTLIFEASAPASHVWTHIREARKIAALMEDAREAHLDDVYLYGDLPHEREEQVQPLHQHAAQR
jgi:hypothetical protein